MCCPVNLILHFGELMIGSSIKYKKPTLFENFILKCYKVKRIIKSFDPLSGYITINK